MLNYDALRQATKEHQLRREGEADTHRLALQARGRRRRTLASGIEQLLTAHRDAMQELAYAVLSVRSRR